MQPEAPQALLAHLCPAQSNHCSISVQGGLGFFLAEELVELTHHALLTPRKRNQCAVRSLQIRAPVVSVLGLPHPKGIARSHKVRRAMMPPKANNTHSPLGTFSLVDPFLAAVPLCLSLAPLNMYCLRNFLAPYHRPGFLRRPSRVQPCSRWCGAQVAGST